MADEGHIDWDGHRTWYRVDGDLRAPSGPTPLVVLHGGPGAAHDYLTSIAALQARAGRPVVFYDQLGCGRSDHLPDAPADFWSPALFRTELTHVLHALGIAGGYHLLGQSWGGMLAMEHAVEQPAGLRSVVIADSPSSMDLWLSEANRLRSELPDAVQEVLLAHERAGTTDDPAYQEAVMVFYERHVCRVVPFPPEVAASFEQLDADPTVYHTMNGPSEFHVVGSLKGWDITPRLGDLTAPALVISGEFDEATPAVVEPLMAALPDGRWELMEGCSHMPHVEAPERFLDLVEAFLAQHD